RFERIFVGEIGADEQPPVLTQRFVGQQVTLNAFETFEKVVVQPLMPSLKFVHHVGQNRRNLLVADRHDAGDDLENTFLGGGLEGPKQDTRVIRLENDARALDVHVERSGVWGIKQTFTRRRRAGSALLQR